MVASSLVSGVNDTADHLSIVQSSVAEPHPVPHMVPHLDPVSEPDPDAELDPVRHPDLVPKLDPVSLTP
jgi:hypothetical protein